MPAASWSTAYLLRLLILVHVGIDSGLDEIALPVDLCRFASRFKLTLAFSGSLQECLNSFMLKLISLWALLGLWQQRVTLLCRLEHGDESFFEPVCDRLLHIDSAVSNTGLSHKHLH